MGPSRPYCELFAERSGYKGEAVIPLMLDRFLEFKPDLPISQVWFHWEAATLHPRPHDWITRTFTGLGWPDSLKPTRLLPELTVDTDTHHVTIAISPQRLALGGNTSHRTSHIGLQPSQNNI